MNRNVSIAQLGERKLIERIAGQCAAAARANGPNPHWSAEVGLGDDAFVAKLTSSPSIVITTDTLIEKTHFRLDWKGQALGSNDLWQALGHKSMACNLSDLAAMGNVVPLFAFVTLGLHGDISVNNVDNLYRGILKLSRLFHFSIVGGDIIRSDKSIISVTVVGKKLSPNVTRRSGAQKGDLLMSTGPLGLSAAGLEILQKAPQLSASWARELVRCHLLPSAQMRAGRILSDKANMATAMMDTSDDLQTSLEILSDSSGVGFAVNLDLVPVPRALERVAKTFREAPESYILHGGEDYQLLFTARPETASAILKKIPTSFILGKALDPSSGIRIMSRGRPWKGRDRRFRHF